jgi:S1-C subfamily serine protease
MQELDEKLARSLGLSKGAQGVVVAQVASGSPSEKAGLQQGDVIERVDGQSVKTSKEVQSIVRSHKVGETVNMLVLRSGKLVAANVKVGDFPSEDGLEGTNPEESDN